MLVARMANPGGYDPLATGLKVRRLSIRLYARGPQTPTFASVDHLSFPVLVVAAGTAPATARLSGAPVASPFATIGASSVN